MGPTNQYHLILQGPLRGGLELSPPTTFLLILFKPIVNIQTLFLPFLSLFLLSPTPSFALLSNI